MCELDTPIDTETVNRDGHRPPPSLPFTRMCGPQQTIPSSPAPPPANHTLRPPCSSPPPRLVVSQPPSARLP